MYDYLIMIAVGVLLIVISFIAKSISYGMAPHRNKPRYPVTRRLRIVLASLGLLSLGMGLAGALHR